MGLDDRVRRALAASTIEHFERRVAADLTDVIGSERLAGFYRQDGRLEASAKLCSMLARQNPSDSRLARLAHVLRGERGKATYRLPRPVHRPSFASKGFSLKSIEMRCSIWPVPCEPTSSPKECRGRPMEHGLVHMTLTSATK